MADLIEVEDLSVEFDNRGTMVPALKGISFRIRAGKTVALVGESGSGKSVIAQAIMGILPETARITGGEILFAVRSSSPIDIASSSRATVRAMRGSRIAMIFQEPMTSLSPLHTIGNQIGEALAHPHAGVARTRSANAPRRCWRLVGFPDPARACDMYPFELSGGLRQRAMIAMALICRPALLIADEPTTALDVTIQAQILSCSRTCRQKLGMAMLLITHDLGVVANVADEVVVIYHGEIMEAGTVEDIFRRPGHPYLKGAAWRRCRIST